MGRYKYFLFSFILIGMQFAQAQKQLVVLKKEKVILTLIPGDEIIFSLKGEKAKHTSYINNLFDTAFMAHKAIISFSKIERIFFKRSNFANVVGGLLVVGGVGYFVIDQFNVMVVNGDKASLNENVTTTSIAMVAVGLPMMMLKKKSQRIRGRYRLLTVQPGSPFYRRELDHF